jgi:hypothetical protein
MLTNENSILEVRNRFKLAGGLETGLRFADLRQFNRTNLVVLLTTKV